MDSLLLIGLAVLAFPFLAVVALVKVVRLADRVRALELRLARFEAAGPLAPPATAAAPQQTPQPSAPATDSSAVEPDVAATPTPEPPPPVAPPVAAPARPRWAFGDFEQAFGTRLVVWVGGAALALGGFFLVRYSIEAGLFGPAARVASGALFAVALVAAGEALRRSDRAIGFAGVPAAAVPAMLTAAGTAAAYATVWAASELYGFLLPAFAVVLLGAVAVGTLVAALLHGPALAAFGTLAAYATPIITNTPDPSAYGLFIFLAVVTAAAMAVARVRLWRWLVITASALVTAWGVAFAIGPDPGVGPLAVNTLAQIGIVGALIVPGLWRGPPATPGRIELLPSAVLAAAVLVPTLYALNSNMAQDSLVLVGIAIALVLAIAWKAEAASLAVPATAILAAAIAFSWSIQPNLATTVAPSGPAGAPAPLPVLIGPMTTFVTAIAALMLGTGLAAMPRQRRGLVTLIWAASAAATPILMLAAAYYRIAGWVPSLPFGALALALAALDAAIAERLVRRRPAAGSGAAGSVFVTAALAALAIGLTMMLERGWLTVALALVALGAAWVAAARPYPFLRIVAAVSAVLLLARLAWDPRIMGADVGTTPVLNWLLWGYGIPAAAMAFGARLLRRRADDLPTRLLEGASILFTYLLVFFEIRHGLHGGDVFATDVGLVEAGLQAGSLALMATGLQRLAASTESRVYPIAADIAAWLAVLAAWISLGFVENPLSTNAELGSSAFVNRLLLGYGLPALCFLLLSITTGRQPAQRGAIVATAFAAAFAFVTFEVAVAFRGPRIGFVGSPPISDVEWYAYSAAWLAFGLVPLVIGLVRESRPARLASAGLITLTVLKVFLSDMADLEGVLRALSFIGLGVVLVGIGWLYQHLLFRPRANNPSAT